MHVYKFLNKEKEIIYIGKSKNLNARLMSHFEYGKEKWKEEVEFIEYCEFKDGATMDIYEIYLIDKCKPKYNKNSIYKTTQYEIILPTPKFKIMDINQIKTHIENKYKNIPYEFNKEELLNRYIFYIPKDREFITSTKHKLSDKDSIFMNKKVLNVLKNKLNDKRSNSAYTISYNFIDKIKDITLQNKYYIHYKETSNAYFLSYLSDFNYETKGTYPNNKEYILNNVLNFMSINETTDKNNKTHLLIITKNIFDVLNIYFDKKLNIVYC